MLFLIIQLIMLSSILFSVVLYLIGEYKNG